MALYFKDFYNPVILPPISANPHVEVSPQEHILTEPMNLSVQRHMLEHADGDGQPGVIINYNCEDFDCNDDFLPTLAKTVETYPNFVYLAPSKNMP